MGKIIAVVGSVTTAASMEKILRKKMGVDATVIHTPSAISTGGCSYAIRSSFVNLAQIKEAAAAYKIRIRAFYREDVFEGEKRFYVIS